MVALQDPVRTQRVQDLLTDCVNHTAAIQLVGIILPLEIGMPILVQSSHFSRFRRKLPLVWLVAIISSSVIFIWRLVVVGILSSLPPRSMLSLSLKPFNGLIHSFMADTPPRSDTVEPVVWGQLLGTSLTNSDPWSVVMTYPAKMPEIFLGSNFCPQVLSLVSVGLKNTLAPNGIAFPLKLSPVILFHADSPSASTSSMLRLCMTQFKAQVQHCAGNSARSSEVETVFITC